METVKTLLRTPELVRALNPLVSVPITPKDVFRLIGEGRIKPCGYIQRVPVFDVTQLGDIAQEFHCDCKPTILKTSHE
jgi:hypothetical protein